MLFHPTPRGIRLIRLAACNAEMEQSINILAQSAFNQGLTTKTLSFDDIFGDATAVTNQR